MVLCTPGKLAPAGHLFPLGGQTASAAMELVSMFRDGLDAITVGEPIAQSIYEGFGHSDVNLPELVLPHSQIPVRVSNIWYLDEQDTDEPILTDDGKLYPWENTLMPDVYVPMDIEDIRAGKDNVIQWVLEH